MSFRWISAAIVAALFALAQLLPIRDGGLGPSVTFGQTVSDVVRSVAQGKRHDKDNEDKNNNNKNDNKDNQDGDNSKDSDEGAENVDPFENADNAPLGESAPQAVQPLQAVQSSQPGEPTPAPTSPAATPTATATPTPPPPPPPPPEPPTATPPPPAPDPPAPPLPLVPNAPPPPPVADPPPPPPPAPAGSPAAVPPDPGPASAGTTSGPPAPEPEASGVSSGSELPITIGGDRIVVQIHPTMPAGITLFLKRVSRDLFPPVPGAGIADFVFTVEARDAAGGILLTLPAEVGLSVHYADREVTGLTKLNVTLSRLALEDFNWRAVPRQARDPMNNTVTASIVDLGVYAVHVP
jgi:hypothetical protein